MARGRFISNSISTSKKFARLQSNDHRLAYLMLIPHVDAEGRHDADLRILSGQVYTLLDLDHTQIQTALDDMHNVGLINLYTVDEDPYLEIVNFHEHNKVRRRDDGTPSHEAPSSIPAPIDYTDNPVTATDQLQSSYVAATAEVEVKVQVQDKAQVQEPRAHAREAGALQQGKQGNRKKRPPKLGDFDPTQITLPEFVDPEPWLQFLAHLEARGKTVTEPTARQILTDLAKHPDDANDMLRTAVARGWLAAYPIDRNRNGSANPSAAAAWDQILDAARRGKPPDNLDKPGKAALAAIGGWTAVAYCPEHHLPGRRRSFLDAYQPTKPKTPEAVRT